MVKKILIAIDDQMPDLCFVGKAIDFAKQLNAKVGLIDVARLSIGYIEAGIYPTDLEGIDRFRAEKTVENVKAEYPDISFVDFEQVGDAVEEIKAVVKDWQPDLLAMGHHKNSFFQRLSENSKERRIINQLNIPVLVIPCDV